MVIDVFVETHEGIDSAVGARMIDGSANVYSFRVVLDGFGGQAELMVEPS